jgi:hypothetical protein
MSKTTGILMYHDDNVLLSKISQKAVMPPAPTAPNVITAVNRLWD